MLTAECCRLAFGEIAGDLLPEYSNAFPVNMPSRGDASSILDPTCSMEDTQVNFKDEPTRVHFPQEMEERLDIPVGTFGGSNAFGTFHEQKASNPNPLTLTYLSKAISGNHTKTGNPLLLGDPHLPAIHPSTWYRWNLKISGGTEKERRFSGVSTLLLPFFINFRSPHLSSA